MSPLLTTREVAALLRVHEKHVFRLLRRGLPGKRAGGKWLFGRDEVLAWATGNAPPRSERETPPLLAANGDLAIEVLLAHGQPTVGFVQADRDRGLRLLGERAVLLAGVHGRARTALAESAAWLHVVDREVGLVRRRKQFGSLEGLARLRWASRPTTAGVRDHLDAALVKDGIDPSKLHTRALLLPSHRDVVCAVARGDAEIGLASRAWADRLGLSFQALTDESYGLLIRAADLGRPEVVALCEVAQSRTLRRALTEIPGYSARRTGTLHMLSAA